MGVGEVRYFGRKKNHMNGNEGMNEGMREREREKEKEKKRERERKKKREREITISFEKRP